MRLIFCVREHTFDEIYMGHQLGFPAIRGIDAISATANARGFTPLTAIAGRYGWRDDLLEAASLECNSRQEVAIVNGVSPTLLLVPKTTGNNGWPSVVDKLINDLLDAANHLNLRSLHFTHYGFIQGYPPGLEMIRVLQAMMNPKRRSSLEVVYWDIDIRSLKELVNHYSMVARQYHIDATRPDIYMAPKFTWHEVDRTPSGHSIHVFANQTSLH